MSDDWATLTSVQNINLFFQWSVIQAAFFTHCYRCNGLSDKALQEAAKTFKKLPSLQAVQVHFSL